MLFLSNEVALVSVPREAKEGERERKTKNISHRIKNSKEFEDNPTLTFRARFSSFLVAYAPLYRLADRSRCRNEKISWRAYRRGTKKNVSRYGEEKKIRDFRGRISKTKLHLRGSPRLSEPLKVACIARKLLHVSCAKYNTSRREPEIILPRSYPITRTRATITYGKRSAGSRTSGPLRLKVTKRHSFLLAIWEMRIAWQTQTFDVATRKMAAERRREIKSRQEKEKCCPAGWQRGERRDEESEETANRVTLPRSRLPRVGSVRKTSNFRRRCKP